LFLCEKGLNLLLSLSVFFILGRFLNYWHRFLRSAIAGINFNSLASIRCSLIHSQPSHLRYVSLARFLHQFLSFLFCKPISTSAKKINSVVFNVNRWWTLECSYHDSVCVWFDAYYIWMQGGFPMQELYNKITNLTVEGKKNRRLHRKPLGESSGNYSIFYLIVIFIFPISVFIPKTEALYFMEQRAASASSHKFL